MLVAAASDTNAPPCLYAVGLNSEGQSGLGDLYERRYAGQGLLVLDGIDEWERKYRLS